MQYILLHRSVASQSLAVHEAMDVHIANVTELFATAFCTDKNRCRATERYHDDVTLRHEAGSHAHQPILGHAERTTHLQRQHISTTRLNEVSHIDFEIMSTSMQMKDICLGNIPCDRQSASAQILDVLLDA